MRLGMYLQHIRWRWIFFGPRFFLRINYESTKFPVTPEDISILTSIRKPENVVLRMPLNFGVSVFLGAWGHDLDTRLIA